MSPTMAKKQSYTQLLNFFESSVQITTDMESSKDLYDPAAFRISALLFKDQMSHIWDYLWEGKFPLEGLKTRG